MQEAIEALKAGDKARAFTVLRRYLAQNPKDANGWLWMSEAATNPKMQIDALERVLRLAPEHPRAPIIRQRLQKLQARQQAPPPPPEPIAAEPEPVADEPSTDEILAQLRGESLARRKEPFEDLPATPPAEPSPLATEEVEEEAGAAAIFEGAPSGEREAATSEPSDMAGELDDLVRGLRDTAAPQPTPTASAEVVQTTTEAMADLERGRPLADAATSPVAPPVPQEEDQGVPWWVWLVIFVSLLIVAGVVYVAWLALNGGI